MPQRRSSCSRLPPRPVATRTPERVRRGAVRCRDRCDGSAGRKRVPPEVRLRVCPRVQMSEKKYNTKVNDLNGNAEGEKSPPHIQYNNTILQVS